MRHLRDRQRVHRRRLADLGGHGSRPRGQPHLRSGVLRFGSCDRCESHDSDQRDGNHHLPLWRHKHRGGRVRCDALRAQGGDPRRGGRPCARSGACAQSTVAPVARISGAQRAISLFMYAANSAELEPTAIRPFAAYCSRTSAELRTPRRSVSSFFRIATGVPWGASTPDPPPTSYPARPDSSSVGTSGASASRVLVVTASARSLPAFMNGRTSGALLNESSNCPLTSSVVICATDL